MTNNTTVTLDDVILNDGDIAAQTSESQIHSNITIDAATLRDKSPRKPFPPRQARPAGSFSGTGPRQGSNDRSSGDRWFERPTRTGTANQPAMPKLSSFLSHKQASNQPVANLEFSKQDTPLRVVPLGGLEEVGANMTFLEYGDDILIIDAGLVFAGGELYGVDYLIPDTAYLRKNKKKIKALLITHGHLDHIGALKHILADLDWPVVYSSPLTIGLIKKTLEEEKLLTNFKYKLVNPDTDVLKFGCYTVEFFHVNHNIPESMGMSIHTPKWLIVTTGDFKIDFTPAIDKPADLAKIARIWQEGVKLLMCESTNAIKPGRTISEKAIGDTIDALVKETNSRLIVATFASNVGRVIQLIHAAVKYNKTVFLAGRSMVNYTDVARELWYINVPKGMLRKMWPEIDSFPDDRVMVLCTGSQWEEFSALKRMSTGDHRDLVLKPGDKIVTSASPIPGNEKSFYDMMNDFIRKGINVVTNNDMDIHASGHGYAEDLKIMISLFKPQYLMPIHGEPRLRMANKKLGIETGIPAEHVMMVDNGDIVEVFNDWVSIADQKIKLDTIMIDGKGMWHLSGEFVIKARKIMAESWLVNLIFKIDSTTKNLVGNIQIESRWFVYSSEVRQIHTDIVKCAEKMYLEWLKRNTDIKYILKDIRSELESYCKRALDRVPMIVPMYVYINDSKGEIQDSMSHDDAIVWGTLDEDIRIEAVSEDRSHYLNSNE